MILQPLTVGPIVGATTGTSVRLWGRGKEQVSRGRLQRCVGVARLRRFVDDKFDSPRTFPMNPNFDLTGVLVVDDLGPETQYVYQMGYLLLDAGQPFSPNDAALNWQGVPFTTFRTGADDSTASRSFVFGSCRYLLRLPIAPWREGTLFDTRGDKTFRSVLEQIDSGRRTDFFLMLGDQIYADDLLFLNPDDALGDYYTRYADVFSQMYIRRLMSLVPTYMMMDDHEIEDNWPARATSREWVTKFPVAIHAFVTYQLSHSPLFALPNGRLTGTPNKLWYTFRDGCCDVFVTDSRTERNLSEPPEIRAMISDGQMAALKAWLNDGSGSVKFVATSIPFFPDFEGLDSDKWSGFLRQRTEILDFIRSNRIRRVVFLSGDIHESTSAELAHSEDPDFRVLSVISSPFFWPYPFLTGLHPLADGPLTTWRPATESASGHYIVQNRTPQQQIDNFTRLTVDRSTLQVEVYSRKGKLLDFHVHRLVQ